MSLGCCALSAPLPSQPEQCDIRRAFIDTFSVILAAGSALRTVLRCGLVGLMLLMVACSTAGHRFTGAHRTVLARGVVSGQPWRLTAFQNAEGNLCLDLNGHPPPKSDPDAFFGDSGCGFGPPDGKGAAFMEYAESSSAGRLYYGPAPAEAVTVRIDTFRQTAQRASNSSMYPAPGCQPSRPAHRSARIINRLPSWSKPGGWFVISVPPISGCGYLNAEFFDAGGKAVADTTW